MDIREATLQELEHEALQLERKIDRLTSQRAVIINEMRGRSVCDTVQDDDE